MNSLMKTADWVPESSHNGKNINLTVLPFCQKTRWDTWGSKYSWSGKLKPYSILDLPNYLTSSFALPLSLKVYIELVVE